MAELKTLGPFYIPIPVASVRRYHAMVKPIGAMCNLDCTYYYLHKEKLLGSSRKFQMSDGILETHLREYIEGQDSPEVVSLGKAASRRFLGRSFLRGVELLVWLCFSFVPAILGFRCIARRGGSPWRRNRKERSGENEESLRAVL